MRVWPGLGEGRGRRLEGCTWDLGRSVRVKVVYFTGYVWVCVCVCVCVCGNGRGHSGSAVGGTGPGVAGVVLTDTLSTRAWAWHVSQASSLQKGN